MFVSKTCCFVTSDDEIDPTIQITVIPKEAATRIKCFRFFVNVDLVSSGLCARIFIGASPKQIIKLSSLRPHEPNSLIFVDAISNFELDMKNLPKVIEHIIQSFLFQIIVS